MHLRDIILPLLIAKGFASPDFNMQSIMGPIFQSLAKASAGIQSWFDEKSSAYEYRVDVPGLTEEDLSIVPQQFKDTHFLVITPKKEGQSLLDSRGQTGPNINDTSTSDTLQMPSDDQQSSQVTQDDTEAPKVPEATQPVQPPQQPQIVPQESSQESQPQSTLSIEEAYRPVNEPTTTLVNTPEVPLLQPLETPVVEQPVIQPVVQPIPQNQQQSTPPFFLGIEEVAPDNEQQAMPVEQKPPVPQKKKKEFATDFDDDYDDDDYGDDDDYDEDQTAARQPILDDLLPWLPGGRDRDRDWDRRHRDRDWDRRNRDRDWDRRNRDRDYPPYYPPPPPPHGPHGPHRPPHDPRGPPHRLGNLRGGMPGFRATEVRLLLPEDADIEKMTYNVKNGVLSITVPKKV